MKSLLASIASSGILGHNSAVEMPQRFALESIKRITGRNDDQQILAELAELTNQGLLSRYNTSHSGYANSWIEGVDTWKITPKGLVWLWMS